jgi:hypothetical protein
MSDFDKATPRRRNVSQSKMDRMSAEMERDDMQQAEYDRLRRIEQLAGELVRLIFCPSPNPRPIGNGECAVAEALLLSQALIAQELTAEIEKGASHAKP